MAEQEPMYQGVMLQYVQESLGPIPQPPSDQGTALVKAAEKVELELYKAKFYGKGTVKYVVTGPVWPEGTLDAPDWSDAVEERISSLIGAPATGAKALAAEVKKSGSPPFTSAERFAKDAVADYLGFDKRTVYLK